MTRPNYDLPAGVSLVNRNGATKPLPGDILNGWFGLADFMHVTATDDSGAVVADTFTTFCPNDYDPQRVDDKGPAIPTFPDFCSAHPFTRGSVWGLDRGWAAHALGFDGGVLDVPDGHYVVNVSIADPYVGLFGIAPTDASATVNVDITSIPFEEPPPPPGPLGQVGPAAASSDQPRPADGVPVVAKPAQNTLPDLVALPALNFEAFNDDGRDYLAFAAIEWNAGPGPLVVEGFRQSGTDVMNAFQYFRKNGKVVGKAPAGLLVYHAGGGHDHWHFNQFTTYSLLDMEMNEITPSGKESWCLAPTDAIDLSAKGAEYRPFNVGLGSACGSKGSLWVREVMPVGWGDTYVQFMAGQSFDITDVPNGDYLVRVFVNPQNLLRERTTANNVEFREITIEGDPGARTVTAAPWHGIDTEFGGGPCCPR